MDILNMNDHMVNARVKDGNGNFDYVHISAKRRVTLKEGMVVDQNWLATAGMVKLYDSPTSKNALSPTPPVVKSSAPASSPLSTPTISVKAN